MPFPSLWTSPARASAAIGEPRADLLLVPRREPWLSPWSLNVIWCLCDLRRENGATLYAPGSQRYTTATELPEDLADQMVPFEAPARSIVAMEGRVWHTSGANVTADEDRPLLFAYYTKSFVRPQWNFSVGLRPEVQSGFSPLMRYRLGLDIGLDLAMAEPSPPSA